MNQKAGSPNQYNFPQAPSEAGVERIRTPFWFRTRRISVSACLSLPAGRCSSTSENIATENVFARNGKYSTLALTFGSPLMSMLMSPNRVSLQPILIERPEDVFASRLRCSISSRRDNCFFLVGFGLAKGPRVVNFLGLWFAQTFLQHYPMSVVSPLR